LGETFRWCYGKVLCLHAGPVRKKRNVRGGGKAAGKERGIKGKKNQQKRKRRTPKCLDINRGNPRKKASPNHAKKKGRGVPREGGRGDEENILCPSNRLYWGIKLGKGTRCN